MPENLVGELVYQFLQTKRKQLVERGDTGGRNQDKNDHRMLHQLNFKSFARFDEDKINQSIGGRSILYSIVWCKSDPLIRRGISFLQECKGIFVIYSV